jgi:hypothetical protein
MKKGFANCNKGRLPCTCSNASENRATTAAGPKQIYWFDYESLDDHCRLTNHVVAERCPERGSEWQKTHKNHALKKSDVPDHQAAVFSEWTNRFKSHILLVYLSTFLEAHFGRSSDFDRLLAVSTAHSSMSKGWRTTNHILGACKRGRKARTILADHRNSLSHSGSAIAATTLVALQTSAMDVATLVSMLIPSGTK